MAALRQFSGHTNELLEAFDRAAARRLAGASYRELASSDEAMLVDFTSGPLKDLLDALSEFRRRQIRALYDDGMSMAELGRALGVTRQRVAVLLSATPTPQD
jgi:DNA-directed RNA polymerase specialized sigma24 family protein